MAGELVLSRREVAELCRTPRRVRLVPEPPEVG